MNENEKYLKRLEVCLITCTMLLVGIGLLAIYAASAMKGIHLLDDPYLFLRKQSLVALLGFSMFFVARKFPASWVKKLPLPFFIFGLLLLGLILIPGAYAKVGGATRWLNLPVVRFQTSEFAKIALILFLAKNLSRKTFDISSFWRGVFPNMLFFTVFAFFLMLQPDFGTTALLGGITFGMLIVSGLAGRYIIGSGIVAMGLGVTAIMVAPYRMKRILAFLDPWDQIKEGGFQIIQSYLAFQNGGLFGTGLGESKQKLFFLPEAHTDFILSVIGEEMGFLGVALVIITYFVLTFCAFKITRNQEDPFFKYACFGLTLLISMQAILNMGVVTGLLPTKGIPLPFISNGSSSLLSFMGVVCILLVANRKSFDPKDKTQDET
ncbi:putative lipid II flippase FtsW [bacterium]|nr:putative lipid II flippase FtsW [bacterium]